jgi:hypothetical protein
LRRRADRRRAAEEELSRLGAAGFDASCEIMLRDPPAEAAGFPSLGAHGCFESHLAALKAARGARNLLILEDDILFDLAAAPAARSAFGARAGDWDIFYGGYAIAPGAEPLAGAGLAEVAPDYVLRQTHCVAFAGAVIPALIDYLEAMKARPPGDPAGGPMHVDGAYSWFRRANPSVRTLVCAPPFALQRSSRSDIAPNRAFDRVPVVREAIDLLRRMAERRR